MFSPVAYVFRCKRLHRYDQKDRKEAWKYRSEVLQHLIIQKVKNVSSDPASAQLEGPVIWKAADSIPCTTRKHTRWFFRDDIEREKIIVVPELLPKRFEKEPILVRKSTATKRPNTLKPGNVKKDEEEDFLEGKEYFDDK